MREHVAMDIMVRISKNVISPASSLYAVVFLSIDTMYAPAFTTAVFPVFSDFQAAFLQEHVSILCNTIVYGDT